MSNLIKKLKLLRRKALYGHKATSDTYVEHLRSIGIEIGADCVIFTPESTHIEENNPHLLTIGDHVAITGPATILCHDYSVGVTKRWSHGDVLGSQKRVTIGNNVFLGWGCTVLAGTTIGDDAVIGAGAVATGNLPGGAIYGGNPARRICGIEEYYERRKAKQLAEALNVFDAYRERFGKVPPQEVFHEYFYLFSPKAEGLPEAFARKLEDKGNAEECLAYLRDGENDRAAFGSYEEFVEYAMERKQE
jgi:acetyltransferase-like isoleucine patch superfamily enzyme